MIITFSSKDETPLPISANFVDLFNDNTSLDPNATPQENANKKKQKGYDGVAVDSMIAHHELPSVDVLEDIITNGINGACSYAPR